MKNSGILSIYREEKNPAEVLDVPEEVNLMFKNNEYVECALVCEKILVEVPENDNAHMCLGIIYFDQKEYEKALPHLEFVSKTMPWLKTVWYYKGATLSMLRRFTEAKDAYVEYVKHAPTEGSSWAYLAVTYYLLGKPEASYEWLRKSEEFVTEQKELVVYVRALILEKTNIDDALICLLDLQMSTTDESMKKIASEHIHKLVLKNIDPLRRTGMA